MRAAVFVNLTMMRDVLSKRQNDNQSILLKPECVKAFQDAVFLWHAAYNCTLAGFYGCVVS